MEMVSPMKRPFRGRDVKQSPALPSPKSAPVVYYEDCKKKKHEIICVKYDYDDIGLCA